LNFLDPLFQLKAIIALAVISAISLKFKLLDRDGVLASIPIGYVIITFGSLEYFVILLIFFSVSGAATKLRVKKLGANFLEKDWIRTWKNVLANGLAPALILLAGIAQNPSKLVIAAGYFGAVGTAFADTLATEIGLLYPRDPRLITSFKKVERGTPGAVSPYGYLGGLAASASMCGLACAFKIGDPKILVAVFLASLVGMTIDSILGATIQAKYKCGICGKLTEKSRHCGQPASKVSGVKIINTHVVNLISTMIGATISVFIFTTLSYQTL